MTNAWPWASLGIGLVLLAVAVGCWRRRRRRWWAVGAGVAGLSGLLLAAGLWAVSSHLHAYQRLVWEQPVAQVAFHRLAPQHYLAILEEVDGRLIMFRVHGDQWQLDARVLKWHGWAHWLGLDPCYQLERLSGRYRDVTQERRAPRSVYGLATTRRWDLWVLARQRWIPGADALYGSATYMPMVDGARFTVHMTASGLMTRPANGAAAAAVTGWR